MGMTSLGSLTGALGTLSGLTNNSAATNSSPSTTPSAGPEWLQTETATIVTILLGLILIVAGLFQFKGVREAGTAVVHTAAIAA